jgi:hypothetical protein
VNNARPPVPLRTTELTEKAAEVVDRIKDLTKIPKRYLVEEAILNYLPNKYEQESEEEMFDDDDADF